MTSAPRSLNPTPPIKGSFPLDHYGECKNFLSTYLKCLRGVNGAHVLCKDTARSYLQCRMDKGLMEREEMEKLGFSSKGEQKVTQRRKRRRRKTKEETGFIAGLPVKRRD